MKTLLLAAAALAIALPAAASAQTVVRTTTVERGSYNHTGPVATHRVVHPVRHHYRHRVRHPVHHHNNGAVVSRTVERTPSGAVRTTTVVRR